MTSGFRQYTAKYNVANRHHVIFAMLNFSRTAVEQITTVTRERRLIPGPEQQAAPRQEEQVQNHEVGVAAARREQQPAQVADQDVPGQVNPQQNVNRDNLAAALSSEDSAGENNQQQRPRPAPARGRRQKKRPLSEIIRENQLEYNKFITNKVPKLMQMFGVSSSDDETD